MSSRPRISVIESSDGKDVILDTSRRLAGHNAVSDWKLVRRGHAEELQAACEGTRSTGGRTIDALPGLDPDDANPYIETVMVTGLGQMRNLPVVLNGDQASQRQAARAPFRRLHRGPRPDKRSPPGLPAKASQGLSQASPGASRQLAVRVLHQSAQHIEEVTHHGRPVGPLAA